MGGVAKRVKRSFSDIWLRDSANESWLQKISDDSKYYCRVCCDEFSCNTHPTRHAKSNSHQKNSQKKRTSSTDDVYNCGRNKARKQKFQQRWLDNDDYKHWLCEVKNDDSSFYCSICQKIMVCSSSHVREHASSSIHKKKSRDIREKCENSPCGSNEPLRSFDERKKIAEIRYAAFIADRNIPFRIAADILSFFQGVGKDSSVLKDMKMCKTKLSNIITNVLGPLATNRVVNHIQRTKFSIYINETSDIGNEKWMTFLVRYVNPESSDVCTELVKLISIDARDSSAEKLYESFRNEMYKLAVPFSNIVALSCDNASVMTGKNNSFATNLRNSCKKLITFNCPCHSSALVAHAACSKLPDFCEEFVKKISCYIDSSPKRSAIAKEFNEAFLNSNPKILKLADTHWLSRHAAIARLIECWNSIEPFLLIMYEQEKSKPAEHLFKIMRRPDLKAYLYFLKYILSFFNKFNAFFQASATRVHLLQPESLKFLREIAEKFVKPDLIAHIDEKFEFSKEDNQKPLADIELGPECRIYLDELLEKNKIQKEAVDILRENCLKFYVTATQQMSKRLPVWDDFLSRLKVFTAEVALFDNDREESLNDIYFIANLLDGSDKNALKNEWLRLPKDNVHVEKENLSVLKFDEMWKQIFQSSEKYPALESILNAVRALPNSNADAARVSSILPDIKMKKRNKLSAGTVNAICVLKSTFKAMKKSALDFDVSEQHLRLMSSNELYSPSPHKQKKHSRITICGC